MLWGSMGCKTAKWRTGETAVGLSPLRDKRFGAVWPFRRFALPSHERRVHLLIESDAGDQDFIPVDLGDRSRHRLQPLSSMQSWRQFLLFERKLRQNQL